MSEYPRFRCLFCHTLFKTRGNVNDHLDHYLYEYCDAYKTPLRELHKANHPIPAIRYMRSVIKRVRPIAWESCDDVVPQEGMKWDFAIPVVCSLILLLLLVLTDYVDRSSCARYCQPHDAEVWFLVDGAFVSASTIPASCSCC